MCLLCVSSNQRPPRTVCLAGKKQDLPNVYYTTKVIEERTVQDGMESKKAKNATSKIQTHLVRKDERRAI